MAAVGGSVQSISIGGRIFHAAADSDSNRKLGGFENEFQANGDGTGRLIKTRVGWMISDLNVEIDDSAGDAEFLQEIADNNSLDNVIAVTYASGVVYQGKGNIVDNLEISSNAATVSLSLSGPGNLEKQ